MCCCACVSMYLIGQPKGMIDCSRLIVVVLEKECDR